MLSVEMATIPLNRRAENNNNETKYKEQLHKLKHLTLIGEFILIHTNDILLAKFELPFKQK